jgi:aminoglycoside 2'-N-acetyltransferase I
VSGGQGIETRLRTAHTADVDADVLQAVRRLLVAAFPDHVREQDFQHTLGGIHALVWEGSSLIGHASVVQRALLYGERTLRTGYVEGVAVRADRRRRGHASRMMEAIERVIRGAYQLGALGASDDGAPLYAARGWQRWQGPTFALTPTGRIRTAQEDGNIFVLPPRSLRLELTSSLTCDWREGDLW